MYLIPQDCKQSPDLATEASKARWWLMAAFHFQFPHDDVIEWKHFPRYWPFVWGIYRSPVNSPHKGQWRGAELWCFDLRRNERLSKQGWGWWFETPSRSLWRHCYAIVGLVTYKSQSVPGHVNICLFGSNLSFFLSMLKGPVRYFH